MAVRAFLAAALAALGLGGAARAQAVLDHVMLGAPDLAQGERDVATRLGVVPEPGGVHPGLGTANALLSLGGRAYLEVIAPAPGQPVGGGRTAALAKIDGLAIQTFAASAPNLDAVAEAARRAGLSVRGPAPGSRRTPDGRLLEWRSLAITGHDFGDFVPFFIDWGATPHPATTSPGGAVLTAFRVTHPQAAELSRIYRALGLAVPVTAGPAAMTAEIAGTKGKVVFTGP